MKIHEFRALRQAFSLGAERPKFKLGQRFENLTANLLRLGLAVKSLFQPPFARIKIKFCSSGIS